MTPQDNTQERTEKLIKVCEQIALDAENDANEFDGKPFDGKTVATYFGYQGAAIKALADVIAAHLKDNSQPQSERKAE